MSELCRTENVKLQENGIVRKLDGTILGHLDKDISKTRSTPAAVKRLVKALRDDKEYRLSWQANIAVPFQDEFNKRFKNVYLSDKQGVYTQEAQNKLIHEVSNKAADYFLELLCRK